MPTPAQEWIQDGIEIGIAKGIVALREAILDTLSIYTQDVPEAIGHKLNQIHDLDLLKKVHKLAATSKSLVQFQNEFDNIAKT